MIKNEWQTLLHNKILLVVLIAILAIPTIYTTLFLGSMWDPYGQLDQLPVAVVNEDQQVTYSGEKLNVGEELVDNLKDNDSLKFDFVDADTARERLQQGKYYMVITIPEDFSRNASTLLDEKPQKMQLKYDTNPGKNYIATKMSESALEKIKNTVAAEVTKTYAQVMFDQVTDVGDGMEQAADGSRDLEDGIQKLSDGNSTITDNLQLLSDSTLAFCQGSDELQVGLKKYTDGVRQVNDGADQLARGIGAMSSTAGEGAGQLMNGSRQLKNGVGEYTEGVAQAAAGAGQLTGKSEELKSGVSQVSEGLGTMVGGSGKLLDGLKEMSGQIGSTLPDQETIEQLTGGIQTYRDGIASIQSQMDTVETPDLEQISQQGAELKSGLEDAAGDLTALSEAWTQIASTLTEDQQAALSETINSMNAGLGGLSGDLKKAGAAAANLNAAVSDSGDVLSKIGDLKNAVAAMSGSSELVLGGSQQAVNNLYSGLVSVKSSLDQKLIPGMEQVAGGISAAKQGVDGQLSEGVDAYTGGVAQVNEGLHTLEENSRVLTDGAQSLDSGIGALASGLQDGVGQLQDGTSQLTGGTAELVANTPSLFSGLSQLRDGAGRLSDGASQLADGSVTLGNGLVDALKGSNTLKSSLADGAVQVKEVSANDDTLDMFSDPVEAEETQITDVENNGHAMAAYMMSVGLWVACIAFCIMYPLTEYSGKLKSGFSWWLSKATVVYPIAAAMALAMVGMLHVINGFQPTEWGKTIIVASIASMAFMSIMYFFNVWLGKVGSFLMLIFMVVQLAGSAGTYPIELSGAFVAKIHKWLPFSYTVDAFRATIAGGSRITSTVLVLVSITIVFTVLTVWMFQIRAVRIKKGKHNLYDFIEKSGLA